MTTLIRGHTCPDEILIPRLPVVKTVHGAQPYSLEQEKQQRNVPKLRVTRLRWNVDSLPAG